MDSPLVTTTSRPAFSCSAPVASTVPLRMVMSVPALRDTLPAAWMRLPTSAVVDSWLAFLPSIRLALVPVCTVPRRMSRPAETWVMPSAEALAMTPAMRLTSRPALATSTPRAASLTYRPATRSTPVRPKLLAPVVMSWVVVVERRFRSRPASATSVCVASMVPPMLSMSCTAFRTTVLPVRRPPRLAMLSAVMRMTSRPAMVPPMLLTLPASPGRRMSTLRPASRLPSPSMSPGFTCT